MELKAMKKDILGFFLLMTVMGVNISIQQQCPTAINSQHGYALVGTEYKAFTSIDYAKCMMECEVDDRCMSVNFHLTTKTCDLNTQTKESIPACFHPRENSVYTRNMAFRTPKFAKSCRDILPICESQDSGEYWIEPDQGGGPIKVLCDMTTDGGGWTVLKRTVLQSPQVPPNKKLNMYNLLAAYNNNALNTLPMGGVLTDIQEKMRFHQIHFYCHKKSVGRVVSIMTKNDTAGHQVVRYFSDKTFAASTFPDACESFDRLPEDTSVLSQNCQKWGKDEKGKTRVNKWGYPSGGHAEKVAIKPFVIAADPQHYYGISGSSPYCLCDDSRLLPEPCSANDTWLIALR